jgi:hypothetical protein
MKIFFKDFDKIKIINLKISKDDLVNSTPFFIRIINLFYDNKKLLDYDFYILFRMDIKLTKQINLHKLDSNILIVTSLKISDKRNIYAELIQ